MGWNPCINAVQTDWRHSVSRTSCICQQELDSTERCRLAIRTRNCSILHLRAVRVEDIYGWLPIHWFKHSKGGADQGDSRGSTTIKLLSRLAQSSQHSGNEDQSSHLQRRCTCTARTRGWWLQPSSSAYAPLQRALCHTLCRLNYPQAPCLCCCFGMIRGGHAGVW
jgi:hypothetical protein